MNRIERVDAPLELLAQTDSDGKFEALSVSSSFFLSTFMIFAILMMFCLAAFGVELFTIFQKDITYVCL